MALAKSVFESKIYDSSFQPLLQLLHPVPQLLYPELPLHRRLHVSLKLIDMLCKLFFRLLPFGDVPDDTCGLPLFLYLHCRDGEGDREFRPILTKGCKLNGLANNRPCACLEESLQTFVGLFNVFFRDDEVMHISSSHLICRVSKYLLRLPVPEVYHARR